MILVFPKMNKIALASSFVVWNPALTIPINVASVKLGQTIIGELLHIQGQYENDFIKWAKVSLNVFVGSLLISSLVSIVIYFGLKYAITKYQNNRKNKKKAIPK